MLTAEREPKYKRTPYEKTDAVERSTASVFVCELLGGSLIDFFSIKADFAERSNCGFNVEIT